MCGTCGCGGDAPSLAGTGPEAPPPAPVSDLSPSEATGLTAPRRLLLEQRLLAHNDHQAAHNRDRFRSAGVRVVNLLSSPGSGKTALLEAMAHRCAGTVSPAPPPVGSPRNGNRAGAAGRTGDAPQPALLTASVRSGPLRRPLRQAVIVADLATDHDARRLGRAGLPALQVNTGQGCHLEAAQVARALDRLEARGEALSALDLLWIENVGNLVCPAAFDLGESLRVVLLATTEGEDKPLKYAPMFHSADLVLISKSDLAEVVGFDRAGARAAITAVAPKARILEVSARSGAGLDALLDLLVAVPPGAVRAEAPGVPPEAGPGPVPPVSPARAAGGSPPAGGRPA